MKYDLNRNELIEAYINGELSTANTKEFESLMERDHRLKTEVEQFQQLFEGLEQLRQRELLQEEFKKWDAKIDRKKNPAIRWFYAAATIAILLTTYVYTRPQSSETLFASYYEAYPNVVSPMARSIKAENSAIEKMMFLYEMEKYDELIPIMEAQAESAQWNFYLGVSHLALNRDDEAIHYFERIDTTSDFYKQKLWYQALSYLKKDQKENCKALLEEIVRLKSYQHKNAALLLEEI